MNRTLSMVLFLALLSAGGPRAGADPARDRIVAAAAAATPESYPNADDVLIEEIVRMEYEADGTSVTRSEEFVKVLTEKGRRDNRTRSFHFTLPYGTVTVEAVEIFKPDGRVVPVDVNAQSRVMVDPSQMSQNIYNPNDKVLSVGLPGLETGDMIRVATRRDTVKARVPDTWSDYAVFEYTSPLKRIVYEVSGPVERPLARMALRDPVADTVRYACSTNGARVTHRWEVADVPRMFEEPNMPPVYTVVQRLLLSTIPDWRDISRWYWKLSEPRLTAVSDGMREKVRELIADAPGRAERIDRLFRFVSQQIRYMGLTIEDEAPGYEPHDVSLTFENRYGVCRDKAALLVAMLRLADLPAYPVLIHAGEKRDPEVPQPYFNHAVVAVANDDGSYTLMDPTDENAADIFPAYLCNRSYLVAHPEGEPLRTSPIIPAERNMMTIAGAGRLDAEGGLRASATLTFGGINDTAYRNHFAGLKPEERRRFFEGAIKRRMPGASVTSCVIEPADVRDTATPLSVRLEYETPRMTIEGDGRLMLPLPWLGSSIGYANFVIGQTGLDVRRYTLETDVACGIEESFELDLPANGWEPVVLPTTPRIESDLLSFSAGVTLEEGRLTARARFAVEAVEFPPERYLELKQALKDIEYSRRRMPVFQTAGGGEEDDVEVLSRVTTYRMEDARHWTADESVRLRILTYAGKKQYSEVRVGYNPAWEEVALEHGRVTAPDGVVREVAPTEINVLDAPWVASAPRYPAARTLVVNLPGVEIGSVLDYRLRRVVRGAPFFSARGTFGGFNPVLTNRVEIIRPAEVALNSLVLNGEGLLCEEWTTNGLRCAAWTAVNLPALRREDDLPPLWCVAPAVLLSAGEASGRGRRSATAGAGIWGAYGRELSRALHALSEGDRATSRKARDLTRGLRQPEARIRAIRDFVARGVRHAGPSLADLPFTALSEADRVLADGYGNSADRAILLHAMLRAAGFKPEFVMVSSWAPIDRPLWAPLVDCPQRDFVDAVLVRVPWEDAFLYLGDTDQYAHPGSVSMERQPGLRLDGEPIRIDPTPEGATSQRVVYDIDVDEDGACTVKVSQSHRGSGFAAFHRRYAEMPPEERRRHYLELLGELSQSAVAATELLTDFSAYPGQQSFTARVERYAVRDGEYLHLALPAAVPSLAALRSDRRRLPLHRGGFLRLETEHRVRLPAGVVELPVCPPDFAWTAPGGMGRIEFETEVTQTERGPMVRILRRIDLDPAMVAAEDYPSLLEANRRLQHPAMRTIMVRMAPKPTP